MSVTPRFWYFLANCVVKIVVKRLGRSGGRLWRSLLKAESTTEGSTPTAATRPNPSSALTLIRAELWLGRRETLPFDKHSSVTVYFTSLSTAYPDTGECYTLLSSRRKQPSVYTVAWHACCRNGGLPYSCAAWRFKSRFEGLAKAKTSVSVVHSYQLAEDSRYQIMQSATLAVGDMAKRLLCRAMAKFS